MLKKIKHKCRSGNCRLELDLSRFEKQFQDEAFEILKRAMLDSHILIVPAKTEEMREAMSKIGMLYHSMVPEEF